MDTTLVCEMLVHVDAGQTVQLGNVARSLQLYPVLEDHGNAQDGEEVDAHHPKGSGEDAIEVAVGKRRKGSDAAALLGGDKEVGTDAVLDEGWGSWVAIAAAITLPMLSGFPRPWCLCDSVLARCCSRLCTSRDWRPHTRLRFLRVWSVSSQTVRPSPRVKVAQMTTSQPCARSQPRLVGGKKAGSDSKKVTKTNMALTRPVTDLSVDVDCLFHVLEGSVSRVRATVVRCY